MFFGGVGYVTHGYVILVYVTLSCYTGYVLQAMLHLAVLHLAMLFKAMLHLALLYWLCCTGCTQLLPRLVLFDTYCIFVFIFPGICRLISNLSWRKRSSHLRFELIICFVDSYSYINKLTLLMTNDLKKWHMHKVFLIFIVFEVFVWECHATCSI